MPAQRDLAPPVSCHLLCLVFILAPIAVELYRIFISSFLKITLFSLFHIIESLLE
jgi:hypothetical protein